MKAEIATIYKQRPSTASSAVVCCIVRGFHPPALIYVSALASSFPLTNDLLRVVIYFAASAKIPSGMGLRLRLPAAKQATLRLH
mmetsp:Transcript_46387/g.110489  ORF Transcript_46387/g.110489 Transcript_46387/m.110489 type:complete len:84 (-) Transcript_46387:541-792(-)